MSVLWKVIGAILLGFSGLNENEQESGPVGYVDQSGGRLGQPGQPLYSAEDYYLSVSPATWDKAVEDCKSHFNGKGQLLSLETQDEVKWIAEKWLSRSDMSGFLHDARTFGRIKNVEKHTSKEKNDVDCKSNGSNFWTSGSYVNRGPRWRWINGKVFADFANRLFAYHDPENPNPTYSPTLHFQSAFDYYLEGHQKTEINRYICERIRTNIPIPCTYHNDLCILVDASGSVTEPHFRQALDWASQIGEAWTDNKNRYNRFAFKIFNQGVVSIIPLVNNLTSSQVKSTILQTRYISDGGTRPRTDLALDAALAEFRANPDVVQHIVVLTNGESNDRLKTVRSANNVKAAGVLSFAVGVGDQISQAELRSIAGDDPKRVYYANSFEKLDLLLTPVTYDVCDQYWMYRKE